MAKCLVEDFATFHDSDFISTLKIYFSVLSPFTSKAKIEILYGSVAESTFSPSARKKLPETTCASGKQRLKEATIILKRFHINSKCD